MDEHVEKYADELGLVMPGTAAMLFLVQLCAFWAVWYSLGTRFVSSNESLWGILPIGFIALFSYFTSPPDSPRLGWFPLILAAIFLFEYSFSYLFAPPIGRAALAFVSLTVILSAWRFQTTFHAGIFLLFLLSLPVVDSLNFYLGYPMRVVVGEAVAQLLSLQGLDVYREGVCLHFG